MQTSRGNPYGHALCSMEANVRTKQENKKVKQYSVHVGWMNFRFRDRKFHLIKGSRVSTDSGPRTMELDSDLTIKEIKDQLKSVFFPNRRSFLGSERRFNFSVGNYDGQDIDENKKLYEYVGGNAKPRIDLLSKVVPRLTIETDSDSDFLPEVQIAKKNRTQEPCHTVTSQDIDMANFEPNLDFFTSGSDLNTNMTASVTDGHATTQTAGNNTASAAPDTLSPFVDSGTPTSKLCIVCFDREPTAYYYPCGHTSCLPCALHIFESTVGKKCPNCRQKIDAVRNIYLDN